MLIDLFSYQSFVQYVLNSLDWPFFFFLSEINPSSSEEQGQSEATVIPSREWYHYGPSPSLATFGSG